MDVHRLEPCMVSTSTTSISIAVPTAASSLEDVLDELREFADVTHRVCAVLSVGRRNIVRRWLLLLHMRVVARV